MMIDILTCVAWLFIFALFCLSMYLNVRKANTRVEMSTILVAIAHSAVRAAEQVGKVRNMSGSEKYEWACYMFEQVAKAYGVDKRLNGDVIRCYIESEVDLLNQERK